MDWQWQYFRKPSANHDVWSYYFIVEMFGGCALSVEVQVFADKKRDCYIEVADAEHLLTSRIFKCKRLEDIEDTKKLMENKWEELMRKEIDKLLGQL